MLQAKLSPRRETVLFNTDRTGKRAEFDAMSFACRRGNSGQAGNAGQGRSAYREVGQDREEFQVLLQWLRRNLRHLFASD